MVEDEGGEEEDCKIYVVRPKTVYMHEKDHFPWFLKMSTIFACFFSFSPVKEVYVKVRLFFRHTFIFIDVYREKRIT